MFIQQIANVFDKSWRSFLRLHVVTLCVTEIENICESNRDSRLA
jgi:hypothetical protein